MTAETPPSATRPKEQPSTQWKFWREARPMALEPYYTYWVSHLTSEGLHAKSDIATVLAILHQQRDDMQDDALRLHREKMALLDERIASQSGEHERLALALQEIRDTGIDGFDGHDFAQWYAWARDKAESALGDRRYNEEQQAMVENATLAKVAPSSIGRKEIIEECVEALKDLASYAAKNWSDDEHDGVLLAISELERFKEAAPQVPATARSGERLDTTTPAVAASVASAIGESKK